MGYATLMAFGVSRRYLKMRRILMAVCVVGWTVSPVLAEGSPEKPGDVAKTSPTPVEVETTVARVVGMVDRGGTDGGGGGEIPAGPDCWETACGGKAESIFSFAREPVPPGFFGRGCDGFAGTIKLGSKKAISTRVERLDDMNVPEVGDEAKTEIELVELSLVSCAPIEVRCPEGMTGWDVEVTLSDKGPPPPGVMKITKTHENGGVYSATVPVRPKFTFISRETGEKRILDTGRDFFLATDGMPWVHESRISKPCPGNPDPNFFPGVFEEGGDQEQCCPEEEECHPDPENPQGHLHCVKPPRCTRPCTPGGKCIYETKKLKQRKCKESGCPFEKVGCEVKTDKDCKDVKDCKRTIKEKSKCVDPDEKGKCKHILIRCDCR